MKQATTQLDDIKSRYVDKAATALANATDSLAFTAVYRDVWNAVGTPGTTPNATLTYLQAGTKLTDQASPMDGRCAVLDPLAMQTIANTSTTLFNPTGTISDNYKSGLFGRNQLGIDEWYQDPVRPTFTTGTWTSTATPIISGGGQTGSTLNTSGWASGSTALVKGDVFTIAGVYSVNPVSYTSTGRLQQFVVTANTSDVTGNIAALPISPSIITSGQLQTVSNSPAASSPINLIGSTGGTYSYAATVSPQSMVFVPDAFAFVMADLVRPSAGAESRVVRSSELGWSIRWVEQYQIGTDQNPSRLDILIGAATLQARLACRVFG
jgi:hypothetical protein